jgi:predicted RNA binding protein YcfA (HicA-like mRNA interferase family)
MPARLRDIARALGKLGSRLEKPKTGSHWKAFAPGGQMYTLPAHNGEKTEIGDKYIKGLCRALGIDEAELRKLL